MTGNEEGINPLKCSFKQLKRSYKKLFVELVAIIAVFGTAFTIFGLPICLALYAIMSPIITWMSPVLITHAPALTFLIQFGVIVIGILWSGYIVVMTVGTITSYIYSRIGLLSAINRMTVYFDNLIGGSTPSQMIFKDPETMDFAWVKRTLYTSLVENPLELISIYTQFCLWVIARFGIHVVLCMTVGLKTLSLIYVMIPEVNDTSSFIGFVAICGLIVGLIVLALLIEPAVACLAKNLNVKFPIDS